MSPAVRASAQPFDQNVIDAVNRYCGIGLSPRARDLQGFLLDQVYVFSALSKLGDAGTFTRSLTYTFISTGVLRGEFVRGGIGGSRWTIARACVEVNAVGVFHVAAPHEGATYLLSTFDPARALEIAYERAPEKAKDRYRPFAERGVVIRGRRPKLAQAQTELPDRPPERPSSLSLEEAFAFAAA
jgi:hypothetical protein